MHQEQKLAVVDPAALRSYNDGHTAVFVDDAFAPVPGGIWVHRLHTDTLDDITEAAKVGSGDEARIDVDLFQGLELCEACRLGPEPDAKPLHPSGSWQRWREVAPGNRTRLLTYVDALLGYRNDVWAELGNLPGGSVFAGWQPSATPPSGRPSGSGASTGSDDSPASSTSDTNKPSEPIAKIGG